MSKKLQSTWLLLSTATIIILLLDVSILKDLGIRSDALVALPYALPNLSHYYGEYRTLHHREPPPNYDKWLAFAQKYACLLHPKEYLQIQTDFAPWIGQGGIAASKISTVGLHHWNVTRIGEFSNGTFSYGPAAIMDAIAPLIPVEKEFRYVLNKHDFPVSIPADDGYRGKYYSIPDTVKHNSCLRAKYPKTVREAHGFFMAPYWLSAKNKLVPVLSSSKLDCYQDILLPQFHHSENLKRVDDHIPWSEKKNAVFWRGRNTGGRYLPKFPWKQYHRTRLVRWAKIFGATHPEAIFDVGKNETGPDSALGVDIGFHAVQNCGRAGYCGIVTDLFPLKQKVTFSQMTQFKYLIVIDGHTWPDRLQWFLATNSVILYAGIFIDYYMWKLEPWVHYVPLRMDLSDLDQKLDWLQKNDAKARQISLNAQKLVQPINSLRAMQCYAGMVFLEYSRLYNETM